MSCFYIAIKIVIKATVSFRLDWLGTNSTNYGSLARVTRLKVEPNMADPIIIKDWRQ